MLGVHSRNGVDGNIHAKLVAVAILCGCGILEKLFLRIRCLVHRHNLVVMVVCIFGTELLQSMGIINFIDRFRFRGDSVGGGAAMLAKASAALFSVAFFILGLLFPPFDLAPEMKLIRLVFIMVFIIKGRISLNKFVNHTFEELMFYPETF